MPSDLLPIARQLLHCRFQSGGTAKRFVRNIGPLLERGEAITPKQEKYLRDLRHKYRKQIDRL